MKPGDLTSRATGEALEAALRVHGIALDDTEVFLQESTMERRRLLLATSIGILDVVHERIPRHSLGAWSLQVRVHPWDVVRGFSTASRTIRDQWNGYVTELTIGLPELSVEAAASLPAEEGEDTGIAPFAARCLIELAKRS